MGIICGLWGWRGGLEGANIDTLIRFDYSICGMEFVSFLI